MGQILTVFLIWAMSIALCWFLAGLIKAMFKDPEIKESFGKTHKVFFSFILLFSIAYVCQCSTKITIFNINYLNLESKVINTLNDLRPNNVVKVSINDKEIPFLNDDFDFKIKNWCYKNDDFYYFKAKGNDKNSYRVHFLSIKGSDLSNPKKKKKALKSLLEVKSEKTTSMPWTEAEIDVEQYFPPLIPKETLLRIIRSELNKDSSAKEETKNDVDDEDRLIYFAIFDEFDTFAVLGCINQYYKIDSKEDMTENLSESQVESEDEVNDETQD